MQKMSEKKLKGPVILKQMKVFIFGLGSTRNIKHKTGIVHSLSEASESRNIYIEKAPKRVDKCGISLLIV